MEKKKSNKGALIFTIFAGLVGFLAVPIQMSKIGNWAFTLPFISAGIAYWAWNVINPPNSDF